MNKEMANNSGASTSITQTITKMTIKEINAEVAKSCKYLFLFYFIKAYPFWKTVGSPRMNTVV